MKRNNDKCYLLISGNKHEYERVQTGHGKFWGSNAACLLETAIDSDLNFEKQSLELCKSTNKKNKYFVIAREKYLSF